MMCKNINYSRGVALIITLWIVVVLSMIAYSLAYQLQIEAKLTLMDKQDTQAFALARAGLAKAVVDLKNDLFIDINEKNHLFDAEGDFWAKPGDKTEIEVGNGTFSAQVIDEESKIDINEAPASLLIELIKALEYEEEEARKVAYAIIDWRDTDDGPYGAKQDIKQTENLYYSEDIIKENEEEYADVEEGTILYHCKNDRFTSIEELLEVWGVTPEMFYGSEERESNVGLKDLVTVNSNAWVNINTASKEVLQAIIAAGSRGTAEPGEIAVRIIEFRRNGQEGDDIDNENAFRNIGDLNKLTEISAPLIGSMRNIQRLDVKSQNFTVGATGKVGQVKHTIRAIVTRSLEVFRRTEDMESESEVREKWQDYYGSGDEDKLVVRQPVIRLIQWIE